MRHLGLGVLAILGAAAAAAGCTSNGSPPAGDDDVAVSTDAPPGAGSGDDVTSGVCDTPLITCHGECVDVSTSPDNCGACDSACAYPCVSGVCHGLPTACPPGFVICDGECRDVSGDPEQCGSCSGICADDRYCNDGLCRCRPGLTDCDGHCYDLGRDPAHCGSCTTGCGGACIDGTCGDPGDCPGTVCDGACADTTADPLHCGSCGNACARDQICIEGACWDYEPTVGCATCTDCHCPEDETCCELEGYGVSCVDTEVGCPREG